MPAMVNGILSVFVVSYESSNNMFQGKKCIDANSLAEAQTKFFEWLSTQSVYPHMWRLNLIIEAVEV